MKWNTRTKTGMRAALILMAACAVAGGKDNGCPIAPAEVVAEQWERCGGDGVECAAGLTCVSYDTGAATSDGSPTAWCEIPCSPNGGPCAEGQHCAAVSDSDTMVCVGGVAPGKACALATPIGGLLPLVAKGNTLDHAGLSEPSQCAGFGSPGTPEMVFAFEAAVTAEYRFWLDPKQTWFDSVLYAAATCPPTPKTCLGVDDDWLNGGEEIERLVHGGETVLLFVDGNAKPGVPGSTAPIGGDFALIVDLLP